MNDSTWRSKGFSDSTETERQNSSAHDPTLGAEGGQQEGGEGGQGGEGGDGSKDVVVPVDVEKLELLYKHELPLVRVNRSVTTKVGMCLVQLTTTDTVNRSVTTKVGSLVYVTSFSSTNYYSNRSVTTKVGSLNVLLMCC